MKRIFLAAMLAVAATLFASNAFAISFSVDVPEQFTFKNAHVNAQKDAKPKDSTTNDVNGFMLTATKGWFGVGYERYEVNAKGTSSGGGPFDLHTQYQFYDVLIDLPMPIVNLALGYGAGTANVNLNSGGTVPVIGQMDATQTFVRLGLPIGKVLDVHIGYDVVKTEAKKFINQGTPDKFVGADGTTLSAGIRLGW